MLTLDPALNKHERALGDVHDLLIKLEEALGDRVTKEEALSLHRAIERCKHWKQPEFDQRFLEPEKHPADCTCERPTCAACAPVPDQQIDQLLELLRAHSYRRGSVTLTSGRVSDFFVDVKQTALLAIGHKLLAQRILGVMQTLSIRPVAVAGVELGGCSLASAVALESMRDRRVRRANQIDAIYVRKEAKEHGSKRELEGDSHLPNGAPVVLLEDVITTGGSTLKAIAKLMARNFNVVGVIVVVDRQEGGCGAIEAVTGIKVRPLYTRADFEAV